MTCHAPQHGVACCMTCHGTLRGRPLSFRTRQSRSTATRPSSGRARCGTPRPCRSCGPVHCLPSGPTRRALKRHSVHGRSVADRARHQGSGPLRALQRPIASGKLPPGTEAAMGQPIVRNQLEVLVLGHRRSSCRRGYHATGVPCRRGYHAAGVPCRRGYHTAGVPCRRGYHAAGVPCRRGYHAAGLP